MKAMIYCPTSVIAQVIIYHVFFQVQNQVCIYNQNDTVSYFKSIFAKNTSCI